MGFNLAVLLAVTMAIPLQTYGAAKNAVQTPASITAISEGQHSIRVSWSRVKGAGGYAVYQKAASSGKWKKIKHIKGGRATSWTEKHLKKGRNYSYKVKAIDNKRYSKYSASVQVKCGSTSPSKVKLNRSALTLTAGKTGALKATVAPGRAYTKKVKWTSSNKKVAAVDKYGKITAKAEGKAKVTARTVNGYKKTCTVTVKSAPYGVFVGLESRNLARLTPYKTVVIDAANFSAKEIRSLHQKGKIVYSYLNVGSIENFRKYYKDYRDITLGNYENWPEEKWIDVSQPKWQNFIVNGLALDLKKKGVDGFFLDNADVYYQYKRSGIYDGLKTITAGLWNKYHLKILINGGDTFVQEVIKRGDLKNLHITGVNQESVFSSINFDSGEFGRQAKEDTAYFKDYLSFCKKAGLTVYLTEYIKKNPSLEREIAAYCKNHGYCCYISRTLELI